MKERCFNCKYKFKKSMYVYRHQNHYLCGNCILIVAKRFDIYSYLCEYCYFNNKEYKRVRIVQNDYNIKYG